MKVDFVHLVQRIFTEQCGWLFILGGYGYDVNRHKYDSNPIVPRSVPDGNISPID